MQQQEPDMIALLRDKLASFAKTPLTIEQVGECSRALLTLDRINDLRRRNERYNNYIAAGDSCGSGSDSCPLQDDTGDNAGSDAEAGTVATTK